MESNEGLLRALPVEAIEILSLLPRSVVVVSPEGSVLFWNSGAEKLYGWTAEEAVGSDLRQMLVGPAELGLAAAVREQMEHDGGWEGDFTVLHRDGNVLVVKVSNQPVLDGGGHVVAIVGISEDVTEQRWSERQAKDAADAERISRERLEFLKRITDVLVDARDRREVMTAVTRAAVPMLGDWCSISVLVPGSPIPEVETAHVDPAMVSYAKALQERFPYDTEAASGVPAVIRTGIFEFYPDITREVIDAVNPPEDARGIVEQLALRSVITVPLIKHGRVLGAMTFIGTDTNRRFTTDDLILAQAVAGRIASTLENLRLLEQQRAIASTLQASLLPASLPQVPGLDIAVRYWAAGEGTEVGGDFYDVFAVDGTRRAITIGDVCGNGPAAAALTGLTRHTLRAAAWHGDDPVQALASLNQAMIAFETDAFCTAIFAYITPDREGFLLDLAIGGHPHPILVQPDGTTEQIGTTGTLVGVFDDARFSRTTVRLDPGDTFVLHTDGVTDVPPPHHLSDEDLMKLVADSVADTDAAESVAAALGQAIATKLPHRERSDDIALIVTRVQNRS